MSTYAGTITTARNGFNAGLVGKIAYTLYGSDGTTRIVRTTANVTQTATGAGGASYSATFTGDSAWGQCYAEWDDNDLFAPAQSVTAPS